MPVAPKVSTKKSRALAQALELLDAGYQSGNLNYAEIGRQCGISYSTVRRIALENRFEERKAQQERVPTEKVCTGPCGEIKPLKDFPPRPDRVGALSSLCYTCRFDWSRRYRQEHPEPIREGSRRRRARIKDSRCELYKDVDIFTRDDGKCWFCKEDIDISLRYPDPRALSIHHIHPISKRGPDIIKNVASSHFACNQLAKDRYTPSFRGWAVALIPYPTARDAIIQNHYLHTIGNTSFAYGLFDQNTLMGVVTFGVPSSNRVIKSACDENKVIDLNRLWIADGAPFGVGSLFLSRALRQLPPYIVIAYADRRIENTLYCTFHDGAIYRACSFNYAGTSKPNTEWRLPGRTHNVGKDYPGAVQVPVSSKSRYWTVTGSPSEKRALKKICKWPILPFGKTLQTI